jgi:hypothetical protein
MKAKPTIFLFFICILLISFLIGSALPWQPLIEQVYKLLGPGNKKVMVVVAKHDYPKGTIITDPEQMFELREFGYFDVQVPFENLGELSQELVLINDIREGEPLTRKSVTYRIIKALFDLTNDDPPGPGRDYRALTSTRARKGSIRVGTRVDVIEEDPKESKILFHDALVRVVMPGSKTLQEILDEEGKKDWVALRVIVDTSLEEAKAWRGTRFIFVDLRPTADNKKAEEKSSSKIP